ncbi:MAG: hypothetical protein GX940_04965 [Clostridiaceae bacterium]|nr:hypothetical protein [Clostridiaceae bacterium]
MQYIKFNCYDLAAQNAELQNIHNRIRRLSDELAGVLNALDPQIRSYENLQQQLLAVRNETAETSVRILRACSALDRIIDIYYAAESKVKQSAEELPASTVGTSGRPAGSTVKIETSSISRGDLVLEDWIAELLYKEDNNRKG